MRCTLPFLALSALLSFATPSEAGLTFTFQENGSNKNLGTTSSFTEGGYTISAAGYSLTTAAPPLDLSGSNAAATALYAKFTSGNADETGLGTNFDPEKEIGHHGAVQLNLSSLGNVPITLTFGSVQPGEAVALYGNSNLATPISFSGNSITLTSSQVQANGGIFDVTASAGNVLIHTVSASPVAVPEPATLSLLASAVPLGLGCWLRRRKRVAA